MENKKLNDAVTTFKKKYPMVTSADLQTFILGWQANDEAKSNPSEEVIMKKNVNFTFVYESEEETKRNKENVILSLTDEQKSEFIFNSQPLYILGRGHSFLRGFFLEYITKTGITAWCFSPELWVIDGEEYEYKNNEFIRKIQIIDNSRPIGFSDFNDFFPTVKKTNDKLLAEDLISIKPTNG